MTLGVCVDISGQVFDLLLCIYQLIGEQAQGFAGGCGQVGPFAGHETDIGNAGSGPNEPSLAVHAA